MRLSTRSAPTVLPGVRGVLRTERPTKALLERLRPGDIAVIDHVDLDRATAEALVKAGVVAVINAQPMVSGRYPNLGPHVLAEAGVVLVDSIGDFGFSCLADGRVARIHGGTVYDGEQRLTEGRCVELDDVLGEMESARGGLLAQLETFTHNSTELLRREQDVLLHGLGLPVARAKLSGRPVIVVGEGDPEQLRSLRPFAREQRPAIMAVGAAADGVARLGRKVDVLVVAAADDLPSADIVRGATDVIVVGGSVATEDAVARLGATPHLLPSTLTPEDAALLVAHAAGASLVVWAGAAATLTDFLERSRPGLASTYLTRLAVGPTLIDAQAAARLYTGRVKGWQVMLSLVVCVAAVLAAIATTHTGQHWAHELGHHIADRWDDLRARMHGRHS